MWDEAVRRLRIAINVDVKVDVANCGHLCLRLLSKGSLGVLLGVLVLASSACFLYIIHVYAVNVLCYLLILTFVEGSKQL